MLKLDINKFKKFFMRFNKLYLVKIDILDSISLSN